MTSPPFGLFSKKHPYLGDGHPLPTTNQNNASWCFDMMSEFQRWPLSPGLAVHKIQLLLNFWLLPWGRRPLQWAQVNLKLYFSLPAWNIAGATLKDLQTSAVILTDSTQVSPSRSTSRASHFAELGKINLDKMRLHFSAWVKQHVHQQTEKK